VAAGAAPALVRVLRAVPPDADCALNAAWALANLATDNDAGKRAVHEAEAIAPLLAVMEGAAKNSQGATRAVFCLLRMAQHPPAHQELAQLDAVRRLVGSKHDDEQILQAALLAAATAGGSEEAERLAGKPETLNDIASSLQEKVKHDPSEKVLRLSDFVQGVAMLTVNDDNKRAMVDMATGKAIVAPLLSVVAKGHPSSLGVKANAAKALWNLALTDDIRAMMEAKQSLVFLMKEAREAYADSGHDALIRAVDGVLFECGVRDERAKARVAAAAEELAAEGAGGGGGAASTSSLPWVMISYNWGHQNVALHLLGELRARGFNVWIDVEQMKGDVIEAMAEAVEGAAVVVSIMTSAYKQSPNCQSELKYTNKLRKPIVPVVAEPGYRPDGWLGLILGDRLYFDFRKDEKWASSVDGLAAEVARHVASSGEVKVPQYPQGTGAQRHAPQAAGSTAPRPMPVASPSECVSCGGAVESSFKFCMGCGSRCFCMHCGSRYVGGMDQKFCHECGEQTPGVAVASVVPALAVTGSRERPSSRPLTPRGTRQRVMTHYVEEQGLRKVLTSALGSVLATRPPDPLRVLGLALIAAHDAADAPATAENL